ncbi:hypothetical protein EJK17_04355 [Lactobacillus xujianguonis]|uniref:Regulatory protein YycH domain-containing protein n=2 Tax=Lactobacillaceae TaxID=33958 RepID=A0A437SW26_9LACO|nr:hypothetical protein EJK17_04355 [Lactobacillus xujianguonis]RVU76752.1 hypothetical protein EJK20_03770 [Lactobacillus xujianguonis]
MKFKFKLGNFFLTLATAAAIVLSIVLWIFIMTNDQRFSHLSNQTQSSPVSRQQNRTRNKSLYDLYIPTNSYGFKDGKLYRLYDSKNNLPFEFSKNFQKMKVTKIKALSQKQANYELMLNNPNFIQLTYPDEVTFKLFANFNEKNDHREFNRIFVPDSNHWLYLGNDSNNQLYRVSIKNANFDRLRKYAKTAHFKVPMTFVRLKSGYSAFYNHSTNWQVYSYLTSHQSDSYFVARLLGTSGVSSRTNKQGRTTYSLNYYTRLTVPQSGPNNEHDYLYTHYEKNKVPAATNRLLDSVYYVHRIGLTEQDLRFFDADNNAVSYTNYIEGIPVFLNDHDVQVATNFTSDSVTVNFNSINFQIPVPFDGETKSLEATTQMVESLNRHGLSNENIERIIVGFHVQKDHSHDSLVNLVPTYYVKAYGVWQTANEWQKQDMSVYQHELESEGQ